VPAGRTSFRTTKANGTFASIVWARANALPSVMKVAVDTSAIAVIRFMMHISFYDIL
jgi:hypothetical protein